MLTFIKKFGRYAIHACMILLILCAACFANAFMFDNSLGKGVYGATVIISIVLQLFVGIMLFCMLELPDEAQLVDVINLNGLTMFIIVFISFSLITLSFTHSPNYILALIPVGMNALLSHRACKQYKIDTSKN